MPYELDAKLHIGHGTLLPLSEEEQELLLLWRFGTHTQYLTQSGLVRNVKHPDALIVVLDMAYQMGVPRLSLFRNFFAALSAEDYDAASNELINSKLYAQTPNRVKANIRILKGIKNDSNNSTPTA